MNIGIHPAQALMACALLASSARVSAQNEAQVCFYEFPHYKGESFCAAPGFDTPDASRIMIGNRLQDWNKRFSSIRFTGGAKVTVWEGKDYTGPSIKLSRDVPDMSSIATRSHGVRNWNDAVSSYSTGF